MREYIVMKGIGKSYLGKPVLSNINLTVQKKEFVCVLGGSGCGKSTLLKILAGIETQTRGNVFFNGEIRSSKKWASYDRRKFGVVFQFDNLMPWRTVYKNVAFSLEAFGLKNNGMVEEVLSIVGLSNFKNLYPHELSGGMRKRTAIARALAHEPDVLLLDQPFDAIDAITREALSYELLNICEQFGKTVVMVTNSIDEALLLANRIVVVSGSPADITEELTIETPHTGKVYGDYSDAGQNLRRKLSAVINNNND